MSLVEVLLYVHRNRSFFLGTGAQDVHLDFHTAPELERAKPAKLNIEHAGTSQTQTPPVPTFTLYKLPSLCYNNLAASAA